MRVLLVEDDQRLARLIARVLHEERYDVDVAHDGEAGAALALRGVYDVAVLDWMLPGRPDPIQTVRGVGYRLEAGAA